MPSSSDKTQTCDSVGVYAGITGFTSTRTLLIPITSDEVKSAQSDPVKDDVDEQIENKNWRKTAFAFV